MRFIHERVWQGSKPGLARTRELLWKMGNPQERLRFVHVAGTNGKGSVSAMLASVLRAAGYTTGLYTSPYISDFSERMQIDGKSISYDELAEITAFCAPLALSMDDRLCISNMAIEAGAKNGIFPVDNVTLAYEKGRFEREPKIYSADPDAEYTREVTIDLDTLRPTVSFPHLPENTKTIDEAAGVKMDQAVIGSCTNGRMEDMRTAAAILKGRKVAKGLRCIVIPATQQIYLDCLREGLLGIFIEAGAVVSTPTCGPCLGGYMGILGKGERAVSTTNRNFVGRMGHVESEVYLASPAVAAASAVTGVLTDPAKLPAVD